MGNGVCVAFVLGEGGWVSVVFETRKQNLKNIINGRFAARLQLLNSRNLNVPSRLLYLSDIT